MEKKRYILLISALLICLTFDVLAEDLKTYVSPYFNFSINYFSDWQVMEISGISAFLSPRANESDTFRENVNVVVENISDYPMTLEQYVDLGFTNWQAQNKDLKLLKKSRTSVNNKNAFYVVTEDKKLKYKQYIVIYDSIVYVLTYTAELKNFDKYLNQAEVIIKSFKKTQ